MSGGISCRCGADVSSLHVADDHQALLPAVVHGPLIYDQSLDPKLLVHGNLGLHRRDQIIGMVHDLFVKLPHCLSRTLQSLAVFLQGAFPDMLRDIA
jgi:hypothetical protein